MEPQFTRFPIYQFTNRGDYADQDLQAHLARAARNERL